VQVTSILAALLLASFAVQQTHAAEGRVLKVLPHLLDLEGRQSLSPSLFERDAYQSQLRRNPALVSGVRFDVQWKAAKVDVTKLKLRLEVIGSRGTTTKPFVIEQTPVKATRFGTWSAFTLDKETYKQIGDAAAWRVSLWEGEQLLGEQKSFVW